MRRDVSGVSRGVEGVWKGVMTVRGCERRCVEGVRGCVRRYTSPIGSPPPACLATELYLMSEGVSEC